MTLSTTVTTAAASVSEKATEMTVGSVAQCCCQCDKKNDDLWWETAVIPDEHRLMRYLLHGYETAVRPVKNSSKPVLAKMGITLTQIFDMDEKNQILVTNVWLDQQWYDEYLMWDPRDFGGIKHLRIPSEKIWRPDIVLYNNAADFADKLMPALAMVKPDGEVFWPVPTKLRSTCKIDVTYFPFDKQICKLKFGSWTYDGFQVNLTRYKNIVDLKSYTENGEWELENSTVVRNNIVYSCCPEPYPDVTFTLYLKRRILYYIYHVIYPCIMMSTLTLLVFCLPPDSGEKIALGITVLLAFSVLMLSIAEKLPETSESVPIISIYLTVVMSMTSISVIMTVFVLNLHHRGPRRSAVPTWLKRIFLPDSSCRRQPFKSSSATSSAKHFHKHKQHCGSLYPSPTSNVMHTLSLDRVENMIPPPSLPSGYSLSTAMTSFPTVSSFPKDIRFADEENFDLSDDTEMDPIGVHHCTGCMCASASTHFVACPPTSHSRSTRQNNNNNNNKQANMSSAAGMNQEILNTLRKIAEKHDQDEVDAKLIEEWRLLAQVVDKILFWLYLLSTLTSTLVILVIAPLYRIIPVKRDNPLEGTNLG